MLGFAGFLGISMTPLFLAHASSSDQDQVQCMLNSAACHGSSRILTDLCRCTPPTTITSVENSTSHVWSLLCRSEQAATFRRTNQDSKKYIVNYQKDTLELKSLALTTGNYLKVEKLAVNTSYNFQFISLKREPVYDEMESHRITTLSDAKNLTLDSVKEITLKGWTPRGKKIEARIAWVPGNQSGCYFDLVWHTEQEMRMKEIRNEEDLYEISIENLSYNRNYSLSIIAIVGEIGSYPTTIKFSTPRCLDFKENNLDVCVPEKLEGFQVHETMLENENDANNTLLYDVMVSWSLPSALPLMVQVQIKIQSENETVTLQKETAGNGTAVTFPSVALGSFYKIRAWAVSGAGEGPAVSMAREVIPEEPVTEFDFFTNERIIAFVSVGFCLGIAIMFGVLCRKYWVLARPKDPTDAVFREVSEEGIAPIEKFNSMHPDFEVERDSLFMLEILGEGAFGIVRKALLTRKGQEVDVAVKILKEKPSEEEKEQLVQEARMLLTIGGHKNVVSLVACVTACPTEDIVLIVEYCSNGDLQQYLRSTARQQRTDSTGFNFYANAIGTAVNSCVSNKLYDMLECSGSETSKNQKGKQYFLTFKDQLIFASQIAEGMEFLSNNRIIHRDLAARNVLVTVDRNLKISDFGLSRDIYERNCYVKTSDGKVPIKWMAIESLLHQIYTTQSDVWSFGVLLWEIMSFGAMPFSDYSPLHLITFLTSGGRLTKPENTPSELYDLMSICWQEQPTDRPRFTELRTKLDFMLTIA